MADIEQLPGELNIKTSISDDLSILLDFNLNLTGYTFSANIVKAGGQTLVPFAIATTDLTNGKITISVTDVQLTAIGVGENNTWWLKWKTPTPDLIDRKILSGKIILVA